MRVGILGPLNIQLDGSEVLVTAPKERAVVVALALEPGRSIGVNRLIEMTWGESAPQSAPLTLRSLISRLRAQLGTGWIVSEAAGHSYRLEIEPTSVDAGRFLSGTTAGRDCARRGDWDEAAELLTSALSEWRGPALLEIAESPVSWSERSRLEELRVGATELRCDALLRLGRHGELLGELHRLVVAYPLRERFWAQLMLALYRAGRQSEALAVYQRARRTLVEDLGVEPGRELRDLEAAILTQDSDLDVATEPQHAPTASLSDAAEHTVVDDELPPSDSVPTAAVVGSTNLMLPVSTLTGRTADLLRASGTVRDRPLLTLVGPGGVGKTRLAIHVGHELAAAFPDGVWMVDLSTTSTPESIPNMIASTLDVSLQAGQEPLSDLVRQLRGRHLLLILDNCEHLLAAAAFAAAAVADHGGVHVLATSRELLGVDGEIVQLVAPLGVDDAVVLFTERALDKAGWESTESETVREICRRLDGLPLAVELAAARTLVRTPHEILEAMREGTLRGGPTSRDRPHRHRSLQAVVTDSYDLQPAKARALFRRLGVFAGDAEHRTVAEVCGSGFGDDEIEDHLTGLVAASLVVAVRDGNRTRFRLLETMRHFAQLWLAEDPAERADTQGRHTRWCLGLVASADAGLRSVREREWYDRLDLEFDEIRLAYQRAVEDDSVDTAVALLGPLQHFAIFRVRPELFAMAERVASDPRAGGEWADRVRALAAWGAFASLDLPRALAVAERCLVGRPSLYTTMVTVSMQAAAAAMMNDAPAGRRLFREAVEAARGSDEPYWLPFLVGFALSCRAAGIDLEADDLVPEAQAVATSTGLASLTAFLEVGRGYTAMPTNRAAAVNHLRTGAALADAAGCTYLRDYARAGLAGLGDRVRPSDTAELAARARRWHEAGDRFQAYVHLLMLIDALHDAGDVRGARRLRSATGRLIPDGRGDPAAFSRVMQLAVQLSEVITDSRQEGGGSTSTPAASPRFGNGG